MNRRERLIASINNQEVDRIPMMYRALPEISEELFRYYGLSGTFNEKMVKLEDKLNIDPLVDSPVGIYFLPAYIGLVDESIVEARDVDMSFSWGIGTKLIKTKTHEYVQYGATHPMYDFTTVKEIEDYPTPNLDDFDLHAGSYSGTILQEESNVKTIPDLKKDYLVGTGAMSYLFMLCCYLRGMDKFLMDMIAEPKIAEAIVNKVGGFSVKLNRKILKYIGNELDWYAIWDDIADTKSMMFNVSLWRKYFKKWFAILIEDAKKYNLFSFYHLCGNINDVIPDLIEIGVQVLDPIQTSARDMDLKSLKKRYGRNLCFHGGIDVQFLLPKGTVGDVKQYVKVVKKLFGFNGGLILGPSHRILTDIPVQNIIAIYED